MFLSDTDGEPFLRGESLRYKDREQECKFFVRLSFIISKKERRSGFS